MEKYIFNDAKYGTHNIVASNIGTGNVVLDIGCNKGYLKRLADHSNFFYGIDSSEDELLIAKNKEGYVEIFKHDLNKYDTFFCDKEFDVIVFGDILEHLMFPEKVLMFFVDNYLKKGGRVIISLPNVANISVRLGLLLGRFNYAENGILDKTHLHLYTYESAKILVQKCSLNIVGKYFSSNKFGGIISCMPFLGSILGFNIILVCQKKY